MNYKIIKNCQICSKKKLSKFLNLDNQPLCDDLKKKPNKNEFFKLEINFCKNCLTAYQKYNIDNKKLFPKNYHYRAANTKDVLMGMDNFVNEIKNIKKKLDNKTVLDIGCNDGSLLSIFKKRGCKTFGIEPTNAAFEAKKKGHTIFNNYLNKKTAKKIKKRLKKIDVITFTNVFAHIENFKDLIDSLKILLNKETLIVIENHYLGEVLKKNQFDTFYHEHPRTYSLNSFYKISKLLSLNIFNFDFVKRYNGNIRIFLSSKENTKIKKKLIINLKNEKKILIKIKSFQNKIDKWKIKKKIQLEKLSNIYGPISGKGFPARASIIINLLKLNTNIISYIFEKDKSLKVNKYVPGTDIKILKDSDFSTIERKKPILINFAWHIPKEINNYVRNKLKYKGKILNIISSGDFK